MKVTKFRIPIYKWKVQVIEVEDKADKDKVMSILDKIHLDDELYASVEDSIDNDCKDGGYTFSHSGLKFFIVLLFKQSNEAERRNTLNHEKCHIVRILMDACHIEDDESACYLDGYISEYMY